MQATPDSSSDRPFNGDPRSSFNVHQFGARGDGVTLDTDAINLGIEAAAKSGGGTVYFPPGKYLSFSIRLRSHVGLHLDEGATIVAAKPGQHSGAYDEAEPNEWGDVHGYQDFGHSHWRNSLIWGEDLEDISITGTGRIEGRALTRTSSKRAGLANKAIGLKQCRNVLLRDFSVLMGGHFTLLATGVDHLIIDNLTIDTIRDGLNIDSCRHVHICNCSVNTMNDDAIVLKSSYSLGFPRATENVTITHCKVSGFDPGSYLDGSFGKKQLVAPDRDGPTGRIKLGTESNGGFKNISISNCVFNRSRGLAIETVDGGVIEDIVADNITMKDVSSSPIFIRLGNRASGPEGTTAGAIRRVSISNVTVENADGRYPVIMGGIPGHPIEDLTLSNIRLNYRGGITMEQVARQPKELLNAFFMKGQAGAMGERDPYEPPELESASPEPSVFGLLPAYGMYIRHVRGLVVRDVEISRVEADERAPLVLQDVENSTFHSLIAQHGTGQPVFVLRDVRAFETVDCKDVENVHLESVGSQNL